MFIASGVKTDHTLAFLLSNGFPPTSEMVIEGLSRQGLVRIFVVGPDGVCRGGVARDDLASFIDGTLPRVLVVTCALFNDCLKGGFRKGVTAEAEFLDNGLVPGKECAKHKTNLERSVDPNAPHF